jgi:transcriptional regulator of acetoin/glycerol metabolism
MVVGAEHFADGAIQMSTAGAPIRHPSTRHLVGTLNLTCDQRDTTPLMLYWVREMATLIEASILDVASATEQVLMSTYLRGNRDSRHPVICMNEHTIVGNAAAIRMLGDLEQSVLWEAASEAVSSGQQREVGPITTAAGESVSLTCKPIAGETTAVGAELRLTRLGRKGREAAVPAHETKALGLPGLAGRSAAWQRFCSQVRTVEGEPLAVIGEPGTGKTATLRSLAGPRATVLLDAGKPRSERAWSELVGAALRSECEFLLLENLHLLDADDLAATIRFVAGRPADAPRVIASYTYDAVDEMNPNVTHRLEDFPGVVVRIPPLRERVGDLPLLLQALTTARTGMKVAPAWTSEAVQTLGRVQWIANVASLSRVVNLTLRGPVKPFVRYEDLPPAIRSAATRRTLSGLDYLEAHAIAAALVAADGNKKLAADRLGIARSTLYRKVRALGIDLSGTAY